MLVRIAAIFCLAVTLGACTGSVVMTPLSPEKIKADYDPSADESGIIVYRAMQVVEVDAFVQTNIPNPKKPDALILSSDCAHVLTRKVVTIADAEHSYRLHYDHGVLEAYSFGTTLNGDGILTGINTQSTPDQGKALQNIASAASSAAGIVKSFSAGQPLPKCTVTRVFQGCEHMPVPADIKPFGTITKYTGP